jgi:hypothetical protein
VRVTAADRKAIIMSLTLLTVGNLRFQEEVKSDVIDGISQSEVARRLLKDMPVENPTANELHILSHHFE